MSNFRSVLVLVCICIVVQLNISHAKRIARGGEHYVMIRKLSHGDAECVGSLLTLKYILAAAQYIEYEAESNLQLIAGGTNEDLRRRQYRMCKRKKIHPKYDRHTKQYDLAILVANADFTLTFCVRPIKIACFTESLKLHSIVVDNINKPFCEKVKMEVVRGSKCKEVYGIFGPTNSCANITKGDNAFEVQDCGTAMIQDNALVAILVAVPGYDYFDKPGLFINIGVVIEWIRGATCLTVQVQGKSCEKPVPMLL